MGVSKNRATSKWMVKIMENPMNKWMIWGYHTFRKHPYVRSRGRLSSKTNVKGDRIHVWYKYIYLPTFG